jgi:hypothetical protein
VSGGPVWLWTFVCLLSVETLKRITALYVFVQTKFQKEYPKKAKTT